MYDARDRVRNSILIKVFLSGLENHAPMHTHTTWTQMKFISIKPVPKFHTYFPVITVAKTFAIKKINHAWEANARGEINFFLKKRKKQMKAHTWLEIDIETLSETTVRSFDWIMPPIEIN